MRLTNEQITRFQVLYKARFGHEINPEQAYKQGIDLVRLVENIYKPMTSLDFKRVKRRHKKLRLQL